MTLRNLPLQMAFYSYIILELATAAAISTGQIWFRHYSVNDIATHRQYF